MNKENINLTRSVSGITFRYDLLPSDVIDERAMDRIRGTMLDGVAPVQLTDMGGRKTIISNIPDGTALSMFLKRTLNKAEVLTLIRNLLIPFEIGKSGIPVNYIVKDWDNIFVDNNTLAVNVFLVPIQEATATVTDIADFFRDIVAGMKFNEADKDNYVARILTEINSDRFSTQDLNVLVADMLTTVAPVGGMNGPAQKIDRMALMRNRAQGMPQGAPGQFGGPVGQPPMGQPGQFGVPQGAPMGQPPVGGPIPQGQPGPMGQPGQFGGPQGGPPQGFRPQGVPGQAPVGGQAPQGQPRPMGQPPVGGPQGQPPVGQPQPGFKPQGAPVQPPFGAPVQTPQGAPMGQPPVGGPIPQGQPGPMGQPPIGGPQPVEEPKKEEEKKPEEVKVEEVKAEEPKAEEEKSEEPKAEEVKAEEPKAEEEKSEEPKAEEVKSEEEKPEEPKAEEEKPEEPKAEEEKPEEPKAEEEKPEEPKAEEEKPEEPKAEEVKSEEEKPEEPKAEEKPEDKPEEKIEEKAPEAPKPFQPGPMGQPPFGAPGQAPQGAPMGQPPVGQPQPGFKPQPIPGSGMQSQPQPVPTPTPQPAPQPVEPPKPMEAPKPAEQPTPAPAPQPVPQPVPTPTPQPVPEAPKQEETPKPAEAPKKEDSPQPSVQPTQQLLNESVPAVDFDAIEKDKEIFDKTQAPLIGGFMAGAPVGAPKPYLLRRKTGEKIYIPDTEFKIGKSQINADYTISENQVISRVHCIVRRKNGVTFIEDNNSTNGTFVDGQKLEPHKEQFLKVGSVVKLGDEEFEFFLR